MLTKLSEAAQSISARISLSPRLARMWRRERVDAREADIIGSR